MSSFLGPVQADLRSLAVEARRRNPDVKEAAELGASAVQVLRCVPSIDFLFWPPLRF
eukprot:SAG31_NODE_38013_length_299_cov_1.695000_1_plen_56_part_10